MPDHSKDKRQMSVRFRLRDETAVCHQRVDDLFSEMDLGQLATYRLFLASQAAAFIPVENAIIDGGIGQSVPQLVDHKRGPLLLDDLADLRIDVPDPLLPPAMNSEAALLGAAYVLEGSRLGGAILRKAVPAEFPSRFLSAPTTLRWSAFADILERRLVTEEQVSAAASSARDVFEMFERAAITSLQKHGGAG